MAKKKRIIKDDPLSEKISQCSNFTRLICVGGIAIPMGLIWISCKEIKSSVAVVGLVITVLPTLLAFRARIIYRLWNLRL